MLEIPQDFYRNPIAHNVMDRAYAEKLYAAFCNITWHKGDDIIFRCSFREAGALVATLRNVGEDYMAFYCGDYGGPPAMEIVNDMAYLGWNWSYTPRPLAMTGQAFYWVRTKINGEDVGGAPTIGQYIALHNIWKVFSVDLYYDAKDVIVLSKQIIKED